MRREEIENHWAYRELVRKLEEQGKPRPPRERGKPYPVEEQGTLFLFDPAVRKELDETITEHLWPQVLIGLEGASIRIYEEAKVLAAVKDRRWPEATRQLTFLLEDPTRLLYDGQKTVWYVRGTISASLLSYMLSFDLILRLPLEVDFGRVILLMSDERLSIPPALSVANEHYALTFSYGRGGGYWNEDVKPEKLIAGGISKHLKIVEAADRLESEPADPELFDELSAAVLSLYGSY